MKIYGPYVRKDGRSHICIIHDNGKKQTKSYPRYLIEVYLNRELLPEETIDHINNDFTDNRIENLQILSLSDNAKKQQQLNVLNGVDNTTSLSSFAVRGGFWWVSLRGQKNHF